MLDGSGWHCRFDCHIFSYFLVICYTVGLTTKCRLRWYSVPHIWFKTLKYILVINFFIIPGAILYFTRNLETKIVNDCRFHNAQAFSYDYPSLIVQIGICLSYIYSGPYVFLGYWSGGSVLWKQGMRVWSLLALDYHEDRTALKTDFQFSYIYCVVIFICRLEHNLKA